MNIGFQIRFPKSMNCELIICSFHYFRERKSVNFTCAQAPVDMEGVTCRFHHPVPVAAEVSKPFNSTCSGAYMRGHSLGNHNLESFTSQSKRPSVSSLKTVSCLSNHSSQAPRMHPLPEQTPLKPKWSCQLVTLLFDPTRIDVITIIQLLLLICFCLAFTVKEVISAKCSTIFFR